jgi:hypothetical protein
MAGDAAAAKVVDRQRRPQGPRPKVSKSGATSRSRGRRRRTLPALRAAAATSAALPHPRASRSMPLAEAKGLPRRRVPVLPALKNAPIPAPMPSRGWMVDAARPCDHDPQQERRRAPHHLRPDLVAGRLPCAGAVGSPGSSPPDPGSRRPRPGPRPQARAPAPVDLCPDGVATSPREVGGKSHRGYGNATHGSWRLPVVNLDG